MLKFNIDEQLFKTMFSENLDDFMLGLSKYLQSKKIINFTIWEITGNICEPCKYDEKIKGTFDLFELGYNDNPISKVNKEINYFDNSFFIYWAFFPIYKKHPIFAVTFHQQLQEDTLETLKKYSEYLGKCAFDLASLDKRMDLYVDYQKKVDFVKRADIIFKALNVEDVISVSLNFFMEVFSAEAVCAFHKGVFKGIGLEEKDTLKDIFVDGLPIQSYIFSNKKTEFLENIVYSKTFNIKNVFFVYEGSADICFALFNVITDIIPDKEFSSLVGGIVSIAVENAENHERMTKFLVEETEINNTVNILNKFVKRKISINSTFDINASTYPARNAGGDFIDIRRKGEKIAFCLADVCGKGYSAAVFTVVLSVYVEHLDKFNSLSDALKDINKFLIRKNFDSRFITIFAGIINEKEKTLKYISCGHDPAFIIDGSITKILRSKYLPIGLIEEDYKESVVTLPDKSLLFAYSDGIIEYTNFSSLVEMVRKLKDKTPEEIAENLYDNLVMDRSLQKDDFTCIVLKDKNIKN